MTSSDHDLLRAYADEDSQAAFAEIVRRYVDLVYSAARRQVCSPQLAEEIAQSVFTDLARNPERIAERQPLAAWLHLVTRRTAVDVIRRESRRKQREQQAAEIATMKPDATDWPAIEPLLDEAVDSLDAPDRTAILLRYFQNKSLREVGAVLGTSDDAAQKRVSRALEQLRAFLQRRGIAVTTTGLASDLSAHALQLAPRGMAATIAAAIATALPRGALGSAGLTFTMTTMRKIILTTVAALAAGSAVVEATLLRSRTTELASLRQENDSLRQQSRATRAQRTDALRRLEQTRQRTDELAATGPVLSDPVVEEQLNGWLQRAAHLRQLRAERRELLIPEFQLLTESDWLDGVRDAKLDSEDEIRKVFAQMRWNAVFRFILPLQRALGAYISAHGGNLPLTPAALAPYLDVKIDPSVLDRYEMMRTGNAARGGIVIAQTSYRDLEYDTTWRIGLGNPNWSTETALRYWTTRASQAFAKANGGAPPTEPAQLLPYLPGPIGNMEKMRRFMNPTR